MLFQTNHSPLKLTALFTHDCDHCTLAGRIAWGDVHGDVWVHDGDDGVIIRWSDSGPDYDSFPLDLAKKIGQKDPSGRWALASTVVEQWLALPRSS